MKTGISFVVSVASVFLATSANAQDLGPASIDTSSDIRVRADYVGTMDFVVGPGLVGGTFSPNLQSPVPIGDSLYFIDQNDGIYFQKKVGGPSQKVFSLADDAPEGLLFRIPNLSDGKGGTIDYQQRQAIFNVSEGTAKNKIYVTLVAVVGSTLPDVPRYRLPVPVPADQFSGPCCGIFYSPTGYIQNMYDIKPEEAASFPLSFPYPGVEHQIIYEYTIKGSKLTDPRPIAIFDSQGGPLHHGAAMLTLKGGKILYATGDAVPFGLSGLAAPQDPNSHLSKLLIVDPSDGSIEVAASGLRNVQYMQVLKSKDLSDDYLAFADIGGWTAEEINVVKLSDILDTSVVENFGWGINSDGMAREGTFYVATEQFAAPAPDFLGSIAFTFGTPSVVGIAPSPEPGFIQPHAQYERPANGDPNGGTASTGPASSNQFTELTMVFSDLASGILYGTTADVGDVDATIYALTLVDGAGAEYANFMELVDPDNPPLRVDPRFFRFPDGEAGVLLEATGDYFRLTEVR